MVLFNRNLLSQNGSIVHDFIFLLWIIFTRKEIFPFWNFTEYSELGEIHEDHEVQLLSELLKMEKP